MRLRRGLSIAVIALSWTAVLGCAGATKLDYARPFGRTLWQRPADIVTTLEITPGSSIAYVGAGGGYFLPYFSEAVGPKGSVYAVEVDAQKVADLEQLIERKQLKNVRVVRGKYEDPQLPDASVDLVFLCNTYHHISERSDYFRRLQGDLAEGGRVAIVEPNAELRGLMSLLVSGGHASRSSEVDAEMQLAGYQRVAVHDFLPVQIFEIFALRMP